MTAESPRTVAGPDSGAVVNARLDIAHGDRRDHVESLSEGGDSRTWIDLIGGSVRQHAVDDHEAVAAGGVDLLKLQAAQGR
jgi:hypothetical protein